MPDPKMDLIPHVVYELWMLRSLGELLQKRPDPDVTNPGFSFEHNGLLESFLMHGRVLLEFLFYPRGNGYVRAREYQSGSYAAPEMTKTIQEFRRRVNDEASHLTQGRIRVERLTWDVSALMQDFTVAFGVFLRQVPEPYLTKLRELLQQHNIDPATMAAANVPAAGILAPPPMDLNGHRTHGPPQ